MPPSSSQPLHVLFPQDGESWAALARRMQETAGEMLLILSGRETELIESNDLRTALLADCKKIHQRLRIATKHPLIAAQARASGIRVLDRTKHIKALLIHHPKLNEALRVFSPHLWRQQLKSRLQRMGLLTVPKFRIFSIVFLSLALFYIVVFRLLPSATILVKPRQESINQTTNIYLTQSGSTIDPTSSVRTMPLIPIVMHVTRSITFDHISKQFIGTSARTDLTIINTSPGPYSLRKGTRFTNQAGMVFKTTESANIPGSGSLTVHAQAADTDLYGQIIGERGNVPAGLKWDIPGLAPEERVNVYAENKKAATGGSTAYKSVLQQQDLDLAQALFRKELLASARQMVDDEMKRLNASGGDRSIRLIDSSVLTKAEYTGAVLPTNLIGKEVTSVPVSGSFTYTAYAYDALAILRLLKTELASHTREGRQLLEERISLADLVATPIEWADDFTWIKLTVDLTALQQYILDPLSAEGAIFAKHVREQVTGKENDEALRIIKNMPEVETARITQWPPWGRRLPGIPSHIAVVSE